MRHLQIDKTVNIINISNISDKKIKPYYKYKLLFQSSVETTLTLY